jgi:predicted nucleotidyltransferase
MDKSISIISGFEDLVDFIALGYKPEKIILFGSSASKTRGKGSDTDLLIIKKTSKGFVDRVVELMRLIRSRFGFQYQVEPLVYTPDEFKKAEEINSIFTRTVLSNGIVLYEKEYSSKEERAKMG